MDNMQNTRKSAASVSKKDIFEIIVLTFLVVIWAFIGLWPSTSIPINVSLTKI